MHAILKQMFEDTGCFPGRDAFIEMLRKHGLMVRIKRRRRYKTTDSDHNYRKYPNLIKGVVPTHPNQIWTSKLFPQTLVLAEAATADVVPQGLGDVMHTLLSNIVSNPVASIMNGN